MPRSASFAIVFATLLSATAVATALAPSASADLEGEVVASSLPLPQAQVTATAESGRTITVFADSKGRFHFFDVREPITRVRARAPGFAPKSIEVGKAQTEIRVVLSAATDGDLQAPSSAWLRELPDGEMKRRFILNCTSCHVIGGDRVMIAGHPRAETDWAQAIAKMKALDTYNLIAPALAPQQYAPWLAKSLQRVPHIIPMAPHARLDAFNAGAVFTEYPSLETDELLHDVAVGPDGRIWTTAFYHGEMWALDPNSGAVQRYHLPNKQGTTLEVRAMQFAPSGQLWIVLGGTREVARLDPATGETTVFQVGMYAHDVVVDSRGDVWLNDYFSSPERIGKLTVSTGHMEVFPLPPSQLPAAEGKPLPYGMQMDAQDRLWCTQLAGNTLVRFDTRTHESKLYRMPATRSGPRRLAVAPDGAVWIPEYATGFITRFDPESERFKRVDLGDSATGPYALTVDPRTGVIWITGTLSSDLIRLDPKSLQVSRFPLPSEPAYMRHIAVDPKTGDVWTAYAAYPPVGAKVVRLQLRAAPR